MTAALSDRYTTEDGQVLLSGIQALVRLPMDHIRRDRNNGLNTAVFISGYRGSPIGGYDLELSRQKKLLDQYQIKFQPGVNEELAATAVWGSQQVNLFPGAEVDGVSGIWYGKTPGVDRSTDAFRHGNAAGSSKYGGVLVVAGDDHGCKSSSYPGQSEFAFVDMHMPVLNPASVQEVLDYGQYGLAMSRYSGCWVAMITLGENLDSSATVVIDPSRIDIQTPDNIELPEGGLNIRLPDAPLQQEERLWRYKRPAALAFCRANKLNKVVLDNPQANIGIVSAGKGHLDLMQAFDDLGLSLDDVRKLGVRILKIGMTYPLDTAGIQAFANGLDALLVIEEKRSLIEVQLKEELYNINQSEHGFPRIIGKQDQYDRPLLPVYGELSPDVITDILVKVLPLERQHESVSQRLASLQSHKELLDSARISTKRTPYFCSGCPHNTSTKVPSGSRAMAGIGCHYLAQFMDRSTQTFTQMGGEGVSWIGQAPFTKTPHVFVNLGDGTYFHSGILAIRAAVAAKVNITYKILYNQAVAMTGGQEIDGDLTPDRIAAQVLAEGVTKLVLVLDDINKYRGKIKFPKSVEVRHRGEMDAVQRTLRDIDGVTVIIYDQACATELRRKRKRGLENDPNKRVIINTQVCEGCGDCSVQSNCLSVEPKPTPLGVKRQINQTTCNKDFSCINGFCPSFVIVSGGQLRSEKKDAEDFVERARSLPKPKSAFQGSTWNILITGIGGTGVVTAGALIATAAHLEGLHVTTLDQTGMAQKGGAVYSHIRISKTENTLHAVRISKTNTDALLACDVVAAVDPDFCLSRLDSQKTRAVVNYHNLPTADFVLGKEPRDSIDHVMNQLKNFCITADMIDIHKVVQHNLGATTGSNIFMLGYAYQQGLIPLGLDSIFKAIELNKVSIADNKIAFSLGRLAANGQLKINSGDENRLEPGSEPLDKVVNFRRELLTKYQNRAYAAKYQKLIERVNQAEQAVNQHSEELTKAVARNAFKLMAYKDEYEVARLYTNGEFRRQLNETFEGNYKLSFSLAPPLISPTDPNLNRPRKKLLGGWIYPLFNILSKLKGLRGTRFDIFGYTKERRLERQLIDEYEHTIDNLLQRLNSENHSLACQIASLPDQIRGYGPIKIQTFNEVWPRWKAAEERYLSGKAALNEISAVEERGPIRQIPG